MESNISKFKLHPTSPLDMPRRDAHAVICSILKSIRIVKNQAVWEVE